MVGNEGFVGNVLIPISRYEELLDAESRLQVLIELLKQKECLSTLEICTICGYSEVGIEIQRISDERYEHRIKKRLMEDGEVDED